MVRNIQEASWLDPRVEVRSSAIHGQGLFARAPIRAGIIRDFLTKRVFEKIEWIGRKELHEHLGYTGKSDYSSEAVGSKGSMTDIESDLYEHFVTAVLKDTHQVMSSLLGYLREAARHRLRDLYDKTQAESRPALEPPTQRNESEEEPETEDEALSRLRKDDLAAEATAQFEAVEATEDAEVQDLLNQLRTSRQRELAVLMIQNPDATLKKLARRMGVSAPAVTQMLKRMATNPAVLKRRASRRPPTRPV